MDVQSLVAVFTVLLTISLSAERLIELGKPLYEKITSDTWFSRCVREGKNNTCERCGKQYSEGRGLQCAHYEGRGNYATRFEPINCFALCYGCHVWLDSHRADAEEFYLSKKGRVSLDVLIEKSRDLMLGKQNRREVKEIAAHYKAEYERIMKLRSEGETRRIEVVGY